MDCGNVGARVAALSPRKIKPVDSRDEGEEKGKVLGSIAPAEVKAKIAREPVDPGKGLDLRDFVVADSVVGAEDEENKGADVHVSK